MGLSPGKPARCSQVLACFSFSTTWGSRRKRARTLRPQPVEQRAGDPGRRAPGRGPRQAGSRPGPRALPRSSLPAGSQQDGCVKNASTGGAEGGRAGTRQGLSWVYSEGAISSWHKCWLVGSAQGQYGISWSHLTAAPPTQTRCPKNSKQGTGVRSGG